MIAEHVELDHAEAVALAAGDDGVAHFHEHSLTAQRHTRYGAQGDVMREARRDVGAGRMRDGATAARAPGARTPAAMSAIGSTR